MVIMILGCSGKIGFAATKELLKKKHKLILIDKNINKNFNKILLDVSKNNYFIKKANLNKEKTITNLLNKSLKKFGKIDAVLNCVYPQNKDWGKESFKNINKKQLNFSFSNHLSDLIINIKCITRVFIKQGYGNMILISSIQGLTAPKFHHYKGTKMTSAIEYSVIKAGIINLTKYLAKYFKGKNIRFNCISPGGIENNQPASFKKRYKNDCLSKGLLNADDLVEAFNFLLSENSKYVNGQNIIIDDGWSI